MGVSKKFSKKRITALLTILIMLLQMFSPYGVLISKVEAVVNPATDTLTAISVEDVTMRN